VSVITTVETQPASTSLQTEVATATSTTFTTSTSTTTAPVITTQTLTIPACRTSYTLSIYTSITSFVDAFTSITQPYIVLTTLSSFVCTSTPRTLTTTITYVPTAVTSTLLTTSCFTGQVRTSSALTTSTFNGGGGFVIPLTRYTSYSTLGTSCSTYVTTTVSTLPPPTITM
jgi:hypothetical protein